MHCFVCTEHRSQACPCGADQQKPTSGLNSEQNRTKKMSQLPWSCAKSSLPAPQRDEIPLTPPPPAHVQGVQSGKLQGCRAPNSHSPSPLLALAKKEGPKTPSHPANLPPCIEGRGEFYPEPLGYVPISPSPKSPCAPWIHHLQGEPSHLNPREKDTRKAGRSSPNLH